MKKYKSGFTLIELLIVIAIIGIITSIVLTSLNSSRDKAYDLQIKQQLANFRSAAEIYFYNQDPHGYTPVTSNCTQGMFSDVDPNDGRPGEIIDPGNLPPSTEVRCNSTGKAYAVKMSSYTENGYYCTDSKGALKFVVGPIGSPVTVCPP